MDTYLTTLSTSFRRKTLPVQNGTYVTGSVKTWQNGASLNLHYELLITMGKTLKHFKKNSVNLFSL